MKKGAEKGGLRKMYDTGHCYALSKVGVGNGQVYRRGNG